jgi:ribosomal protein S6--L-glutamate ligase
VIDGKAVAGNESNSFLDEYGANLQRGRVTKSTKLTAAEKRMAVRAAKAIGLKVAGVDMIRSSRGPLVLNINAVPNLQHVEGNSGKDLAGMLIHAVEKKLKWKRPLHSSNGTSDQ